MLLGPMGGICGGSSRKNACIHMEVSKSKNSLGDNFVSQNDDSPNLTLTEGFDIQYYALRYAT